MPRLIDADVLLAELQTIFDEREEEERFTGGRAKGPTWNDALYCVLTAPEVKSGWIPVTERLPEYGIDVLTDNGYGDYEINHTIGGGWYWEPVAAWMPLPEPWKGGADMRQDDPSHPFADDVMMKGGDE